LLVGVAHEGKRREPLEAFVEGIEPADRLIAGETDAGAPDYVRAELFFVAVLETGGVVGANDVVADFSQLSVTIALSLYCAIISMVLPLAIGIQTSTGGGFGRGTTVMSLSS
jgi:hypothetical protein